MLKVNEKYEPVRWCSGWNIRFVFSRQRFDSLLSDSKKMVVAALLAGSQHERDGVRKKLENLPDFLEKQINGIPPPLCGREVCSS